MCPAVTTTSLRPVYRGRFAPSPTGPLHFGSLVAAVGSYLRARSQDGQWLVRMEDVDLPRTVPGSDCDILRTLTRFGMEWDAEVTYQSPRSERYREAIQALLDDRWAFHCGCTRRDLAGAIYPGTCRDGLPAGRRARSVRARVTAADISFPDRVQGSYSQRLAESVGDFVILRAEGYAAYQLAVVVDDADQGISEVVRGSDLLESTPRQIHLQRLLGFATPDYMHLPVAVDPCGVKLSKQTAALPVDARRPGPALFEALAFLGQAPPPDLAEMPLREAWDWAIANWSSRRIPRRLTIPLPHGDEPVKDPAGRPISDSS